VLLSSRLPCLHGVVLLSVAFEAGHSFPSKLSCVVLISLSAMEIVPFSEQVVAFQLVKDFPLGPKRLHDMELSVVGCDDVLLSKALVIGRCQLVVLS